MSMYSEYLNPYVKARLDKGISQEALAELTDVSVESIRAYESGVRIPKDKTVEKMAIACEADWLPIQHLLSNELAEKYLPKPKIGSPLPQAACGLFSELERARSLTPKLMEIGSSGELCVDDAEEFNKLMQSLFSLAGAVLTLRYCDMLSVVKSSA